MSSILTNVPQDQPSIYDFIVIGSGPGGGPVAANLSRAGHTVLLLEAGDDQGNNLDEQIPARFLNWEENALQRWDFFVKHFGDDEKQAARDPKMTWRTPDGSIFVGTDPPVGSKQLGIYYPRSGTLGGCAAHNAMVAVLPPNEDWDYIAEVTEDDSWRAENMRRFFESVERNNYLPAGTPWHGFDGWFETNHSDPSALEAAKSVLSAALTVETGHRPPPQDPLRGLLRDINNADPAKRDGVYEMTMHMTGHGKRSSPRDYLVATANARNAHGERRYPLFVKTNSFATRILFENRQHRSHGKKPKAIGVEYLQGQSLYQADPRWNKKNAGVKTRAYARQEVIVACGAFNTPQLLKLSGIGPKKELEKHDIDIVVDLPGVGTNLQDNYEFSVVAKAQDTSLSSLNQSRGLTAGDPLFAEWVRTGKGPYASNLIPFSIFHTSTSSQDFQPDLHIFGGAFTFTGFFPGYSGSTAINNWTWDILKIRPRNMGTVKLRSTNPLEAPDIDFNYFPTSHGDAVDTERDLEAMKEGTELARRINKQIEGSSAPFEEITPLVKSDAQIKQAIRNEAFGHHASSSCAIGSDKNKLACLDSRFRVRGVEYLRVVDASSFPRVVGSFPTIAIAVMAEKATKDILEDVKRREGSDKVLDGVRAMEVLVEDRFDNEIVRQQAEREATGEAEVNEKKRKGMERDGRNAKRASRN
ncbi:choline dehydrogenase [Clohesyomyces aquaticus]|uniref:Choline dehydrogenase n=1 Tax=Clohesyomyces aquaticus TaxID=1231657 RepID=A0A1Y1YHZ7_9PLEO|nr:choline dehydrogenase [Clohesyomyces aquaticus]